MPVKTTLECPRCGNVAQTTKAVLPGAKVRCTRCRHQFRFLPSESDSVEDLPGVGDIGAGLLNELFTPENKSTPVVTSGEAQQGYRSVTNQRFSPQPGAPASTRSKELLIGGKPIRFEGSRKFTTVILIGLLMMGLYLFFWWFRDWIFFLDRTTVIVKQKKENQFKTRVGATSRETPKTSLEIAIPPEDPAQPRTDAGIAVSVGDLEVYVVSAQRQSEPEERLILTLQITNRSSGSMLFHFWSHPDNRATLRDQSPNMNYHALIAQPTTPAQKVLKPNEMIRDVLVFGPTSRFFDLELDLPVSGSQKRFRFLIRTDFIKETP
jgi:hypothetical protein